MRSLQLISLHPMQSRSLVSLKGVVSTLNSSPHSKQVFDLMGKQEKTRLAELARIVSWLGCKRSLLSEKRKQESPQKNRFKHSSAILRKRELNLSEKLSASKPSPRLKDELMKPNFLRSGIEE